MRSSAATLGLLLCAAVLAAAPGQPWGNGSGANPDFPYYGVHDAIAHLAFEKLQAQHPEAAVFIAHWFLPEPGGYGGGFHLLHTYPQDADNFLGYTDDPDAVFQDWCNHLYYVHPRPGRSDQCAPGHVASLHEQLTLNLTLWMATGEVPCGPFEHQAAYLAGLMAHYVGDMGQWGHTDYTRKDHSRPAVDPQGRTYHGYYESAVWGSQALRALLAEQRARPWVPGEVPDPAEAVVALAERVNRPDGVTVDYQDLDGSTVQVGSGYHAKLTAYVQAYDAAQSHLGMRGYTPWLWAQAADDIDGSVALLADLYLDAWTRARATAPAVGPLPGTPGCPAA